MLSAFCGFIEEGDEVIVFEPFFDQSVSIRSVSCAATNPLRYISNIEIPGGKVVYVPLHPPPNGTTENTSAADWTIDFSELERAITPRTKMLVLNTPHNPIGKVFSKAELLRIGDMCIKNQILILSDEVYDRLYYVPFTRIATLSPELEKITLTVGSAGKNFYATGWRVGFLIGIPELIKYVSAAHTRICFTSVSPLQEAVAVGFELADSYNFWDTAKTDMRRKIDLFNAVWLELGLPFSDPEGGYFVMVNMAKVKIPENYEFPENVKSRPRDFRMSWFLMQEVGVAAIPPTEFYKQGNEHLGEDWMRFAVCKEDEVLERAKERLRGLRKYIE